MNRVNIVHVLHVIALSLLFESIFLLLCVPIAIIYHEQTVNDLLISFAIILGLGLVAFFRTKKTGLAVSKKDVYLSVVLTWLLICTFGAIPYYLTGAIPDFVDALFESVSGFTTTGSSILNNIEAMPKSLLFWRAETHWLGGMGIIVLVMAFLPYFKIGGHQMMMAEGSYFNTDKIKARTVDVAKRLWFVYLILTVMETVALKLAGMNLFDSVCHAFATIATGGFSTKNSSLIDVSPTIQYIVILFMILSGMNFIIHYLFFHGKIKKIWRNEELKAYLLIILVASVVITLFVYNFNGERIEPIFRNSLFQVSSIITATGFVSDDYLYWPLIAKFILLMVMLTGASVGSTGGGIKVARYLVFFKSVRQRLKLMVRPNSIQVIRFNKAPLSEEIVSGILGFMFIYFATIVVGSMVMMLAGLDFISSTSSIITTLGGIGPGYGAVGPVENFASINDVGKLYLSFNMILGRLEILSVLVLFIPSFYKQH